MILKKSIEKIAPWPCLYGRAFLKLLLNKNSYLYTSGWMKSIECRKPLDQHGSPLPWMNYAVIKFLEDRLTSDMDLFEYGSGYSTLFYSARVKSVVSVEYDEAWLHIISPKIPCNARIILSKLDEHAAYAAVIGSIDKLYDVIIVDGRDRVQCMQNSIPHLKENGVLILDDSQREAYQDGLQYALNNGYKALHFEGLKPMGNSTDRTTIFYKKENCFNL